MNKSKRGGDRNTGHIMSFNTSGLSAIGFGITVTGIRFVRVSFGPKRTEFSVQANGVTGALKKAIEKRTLAGLPAPSLRRARRAYDQFDWRGEAERLGVEDKQR